MKNSNLLIGISGMAVIACFFYSRENKVAVFGKSQAISSPAKVTLPPPCIQLYEAIKRYAKEEGIPLKYAFGVAYAETRYEGPTHWKYRPGQVSSAGAVGPMQIIPRYGKHHVPERAITGEDLRTDIDLNVKVSMKMLRALKDRHGDWPRVFGAYNTGKPCINEYAKCVYNYKPLF